MNNHINFNTNYQTGDNNVNIFQNQRRELTQEVGKQLEGLLDKNKTIHIVSLMGDSEAHGFASQIQNYLNQNGYKTDGINQAIFDRPVLGQNVRKTENGDYEVIIGSK